jgi:nicotinamidase/pyrazinamidase
MLCPLAFHKGVTPVRVKLFIVDPQNDFIGNEDGSPLSEGNYAATLAVKGAVGDMGRLATMIDRVGPKLEDIDVTLDSHRPIDVAHAAFWQDSNGKPPPPFTLITNADIQSGKWHPRRSAYGKRMLEYTSELERRGKYVLLIWPDHCLIGSWGHNVYAPLMKALNDWQRKEFAVVGFHPKGSNIFTEHYGGLMAEVPDPNDPGTQLDLSEGGIIHSLQQADIVAIAGEASSHCVSATVEQIVDNIGDSHLHKINLLVDCMSPVPAQPGTPDFPALAAAFIQKMQARGVKAIKSTDFLT